VRLIRATLSVMLGDAIDDMIIVANPALGINRKGRKSPDPMSQADRKKNIKAMTTELATFLTVASTRCSHRSALYFLLMADAGLRSGEACAIQWPDFDAVGQTLRVKRAVTGSGRIKEIKTGEAREVDLTPPARRGVQRVSGRARGRGAGRRKERQPALGLRNTQRADIAYVARQLGHAKMTTKLLFYGHSFPKGDRRYVELMESVRAAAPLLDVPTAADDAGVALDHES
jgi:integrase